MCYIKTSKGSKLREYSYMYNNYMVQWSLKCFMKLFSGVGESSSIKCDGSGLPCRCEMAESGKTWLKLDA